MLFFLIYLKEKSFLEEYWIQFFAGQWTNLVFRQRETQFVFLNSDTCWGLQGIVCHFKENPYGQRKPELQVSWLSAYRFKSYISHSYQNIRKSIGK